MLRIFLFVALSMIFSNSIISQDGSLDPVESHVDKVFPAISMDKEELANINTIHDINDFFKSEWVRSFNEVVYTVYQNGSKKQLKKPDGNMDAEVFEFISSTDNGFGVRVDIQYIPENSLKDNGPKRDNFSFVINPEKEAAFPGGKTALRKYLDEQVLAHVSKDILPGYSLAAAKFTVSAQGEIQNIKIVESSKDQATDDLILNAIKNMPKWIPAEYADKTKVAQDNMLTVGNMRSCTINTLSIKRKNFELE